MSVVAFPGRLGAPSGPATASTVSCTLAAAVDRYLDSVGNPSTRP